MMKVPTLDCCQLVSAAVCLMFLLCACIAAPLDSYYQTEETDVLSPQRLELLKDLREVIELEERNKQEELGKTYTVTDSEPTGLMRVMPQKRFRPFRTQTRGGGVALCLWKVCPAAPWLVQRR